MRVRRAVAARGVVGVVIVRGLAVGAEPAVDRRVAVQAVVEPEQRGFAIAQLHQRRRQGTAPAHVGRQRPDLVHALIRHRGVELHPCRTAAERHDIADLGQVFLPALMGEILAGRTSLHRPDVEVGVAEVRAAGIGEIGVVGQPFSRGLVHRVGEMHVRFGPPGDRLEGPRLLQVEPRHRLGEGLRPEERTARRPGRDALREGAGSERTQPVHVGQHAQRREGSPSEQVTSRDLALRQAPDDLGPVFPRAHGFANARPGCIFR